MGSFINLYLKESYVDKTLSVQLDESTKKSNDHHEEAIGITKSHSDDAASHKDENKYVKVHETSVHQHKTGDLHKRLLKSGYQHEYDHEVDVHMYKKGRTHVGVGHNDDSPHETPPGHTHITVITHKSRRSRGGKTNSLSKMKES